MTESQPISPTGVFVSPYYQFRRDDVRALIPSSARYILDVGCAAGALGAALKKERPSVQVDGIEVQSGPAAEARRHLDRVFCGKVEDVAPTLGPSLYNAIVLADVLEHTVDPALVLRLVRPCLAQGGELIVSIPNVRHFSVLRQLLEGRFDYVELGILDRTHLRFFTRMTLLSLLAHEGFAPLRLHYTEGGEGAPSALVQALSEQGLSVETLKEESCAYQYLVSCRVAPPLLPVQDDGGLVELLKEALRAVWILLEPSSWADGAGGQVPLSLRAAQYVALIGEATSEGKVSPDLSRSFTRVVNYVLTRLCRGGGDLRQPLTEAQVALEALLRALGVDEAPKGTLGRR